MTKTNIVVDPYVGSGTTIIACENLNRKCRAVEISPAYVAVSIERWHQHTGLMPELME
jgi:DNA modification methylase